MSKVQKPKYKHFNRKQTRSSLDINLKGFLCSCNSREKECITEAYNLLNKYADILYPVQPEPEEKSEDNTNHSEPSIEDELQKEISALKSKKKRFQQVESGAKNFLFIKTTLENPVELAHKIVSDIKINNTAQTRFLIRLIPIEVTCKAYVKDISTAFEPLAEKYFKESPTTFSIVYNHRNNSNVNKDELLKAVAELVSTANPSNKVDLKNANVSIVIEVIRSMALIGVVPDFMKYKKYNLLAVVDTEQVIDQQKDEPNDEQN
ncbi:THUMP domain-containing protein 1 homolog [Diabrotica undecimpunctata]|uniref:THUMP domain-containing protein 1 homolog n=1 Tax=Diabrotica undecimpunctata TaxID=50387 RepID=UPI003B638DC2